MFISHYKSLDLKIRKCRLTNCLIWSDSIPATIFVCQGISCTAWIKIILYCNRIWTWIKKIAIHNYLNFIMRNNICITTIDSSILSILYINKPDWVDWTRVYLWSTSLRPILCIIISPIRFWYCIVNQIFSDKLPWLTKNYW